jgi:hypothetical protein
VSRRILISVAAVAVCMSVSGVEVVEAKRHGGKWAKAEKKCSSKHGRAAHGHKCRRRDDDDDAPILKAPAPPKVTAKDRSATVRVSEERHPPSHTVLVYAGTSRTNLKRQCRINTRSDDDDNDCKVGLENGQRYLFAAAYERHGVAGKKSSLVSGWPDWCDPEDFDSPDQLPGSNCWRPFADTSPWNSRIQPGTPDLAAGVNNAKYSSAESVEALATCDPGDSACETRHGMRPLTVGNSQSNVPPDFKHPIYYAKPTDPLVRLHSRDCETGADGFSPLDGKLVRIPAEAQPAKGEDNHLAIVVKQTAAEPADGHNRFFEYGLWCAEGPPGGTWDDGEVLNFDAGRRVLLDGEGIGAAGTAARFPSLGGRIRAVELENRLIRHALFLTAARLDDFGCVYPGIDRSVPIHDTGPIVFGTRFQLKDEPVPGVDWRTWMKRSHIPEWQRTILTALHDYGGYVGDRTGTPGFIIGLESGMSNTAFGRFDRFQNWAVFTDDPSTTADGISVDPLTGNVDLSFDDDVDWGQILRAVQPARATCPPEDPPVSQDSSG